MRILIVEDSRRLQRALSSGFRKSGFAVDSAGDGEEGLRLANSGDYDVIVLDLMLPVLDGLTVLRRLRRAGKDTHVLILTARQAVEDRVKGLDAGADDYLPKPFAFDELLARVQALVRRRYGVKRPVVRVGDLEVDTTTRSASRKGRGIELTAREYALLEYLALRAGQVVTRVEIEGHLYEGCASPVSNAVDSAVCNLRKKIRRGRQSELIHTRRGSGYVMEAEVR